MKFDEFNINITINGLKGKQTFELEESHKTPIVMMVLQSHFECARCGACCTTATKDLAVYEVDILALAEDLHMSKKKFKKKYLSHKKEYTPEGLIFYRMKFPCPFYNKEIKGCDIYKLRRPTICRTHPIADKWVPGLTEYLWGVCGEEDCPGMKDSVGTTPEQWLIMKIKKQNNNCDDEAARKILEEEMLKTIDKYMKTLEKLDKLKEIGVYKEKEM